ncbi:hypothetical protein TIFTF001_029453 [Ficus carica]|uniref:Uncharacterized protein n=1 Tax=Ficus carica TaxID=3494 RepID=A0AA88DW08_FICCA|nr:hypothetical protein TIFTF001_029453 [Ficus carica]
MNDSNKNQSVHQDMPIKRSEKRMHACAVDLLSEKSGFQFGALLRTTNKPHDEDGCTMLLYIGRIVSVGRKFIQAAKDCIPTVIELRRLNEDTPKP